MGYSVEFTPPYIRQGLYDNETRQLIEASNKATIVLIFKLREEEKRQAYWVAKQKAGHDSGMHWPGGCPWCPSNVYYD